MGVKVLLAAGAAVIINGLAVTLTKETEFSIDAAVTVDQAAEMCNLANLNVDLTHVDETPEVPVVVTYAPADASRQETPVTEDTPAPSDAPTADALVSGDATAPAAPEPVEVPAEAEPATVPADTFPAELTDVTTAGAVGDGVTDDTAAIQTAFTPVEDAPEPMQAADPVVEADPVLQPVIETPAPAETPEQVFEGEVNAAEKEFEAAVEGDKAAA